MRCFSTLMTVKTLRKVDKDNQRKIQTFPGRVRVMGSVFVCPLGNDLDRVIASLHKGGSVQMTTELCSNHKALCTLNFPYCVLKCTWIKTSGQKQVCWVLYFISLKVVYQIHISASLIINIRVSVIEVLERESF